MSEGKDAPSAYKLNRRVLELNGILNMWVTQLGHYKALHNYFYAFQFSCL